MSSVKYTKPLPKTGSDSNTIHTFYTNKWEREQYPNCSLPQKT